MTNERLNVDYIIVKDLPDFALYIDVRNFVNWWKKYSIIIVLLNTTKKPENRIFIVYLVKQCGEYWWQISYGQSDGKSTPKTSIMTVRTVGILVGATVGYGHGQLTLISR